MKAHYCMIQTRMGNIFLSVVLFIYWWLYSFLRFFISWEDSHLSGLILKLTIGCHPWFVFCFRVFFFCLGLVCIWVFGLFKSFPPVLRKTLHVNHLVRPRVSSVIFALNIDLDWGSLAKLPDCQGVEREAEEILVVPLAFRGGWVIVKEPAISLLNPSTFFLIISVIEGGGRDRWIANAVSCVEISWQSSVAHIMDTSLSCNPGQPCWLTLVFQHTLLHHGCFSIWMWR